MAREHRKDRGFFAYTLADGSVRYTVRVYRHHHPHKWSGFTTKHEARQWYEDRRRDIREGRPFPERGARGPTMADVIERYLLQATNKKGYGNEILYGAFWTAQLGHCPPRLLAPTQIDEARTKLLLQGHDKGRGKLSHSTVNRYVAWLHHVLKIEVERGSLDKNPCSVFVRSPRRGGQKFTEPPAPEVEFTQAEEAAIAKELGIYADVPTLAILTGLRQDELFGLAKADLFLDLGYGKLHDPKGGDPQVFLINARAGAIFRGLIVQAGTSPWIFPDRRDAERHVHPKSWYNVTFRNACKRAGIVLSRKQGKTFHTLRHTFAARLQAAGVEVKDIKDLGRWKSWKAMERYLKRDTGRLRSAIESIGTARKQSRIEPSEPQSIA